MGNLLVISGAGLSAPSGLSTFRASDGLWMGHDIDVVCNGLTWRNHRQEVHEFYNKRRTELAGVIPTAGHHMIAGWKNDYGDRAIVLTQNVDDLLERAGCTGAVHLHGYLQDLKCIACGHVWNIGYAEWNHETDRCPKCSSVRGVKPGVVFFNDNAPNYVHLHRAIKNLRRDDIVVVIGTSGQVLPIVSMLFDKTSYKILNNLDPCEHITEDVFDMILYQSIEDAAEAIDKVVRDRMDS